MSDCGAVAMPHAEEKESATMSVMDLLRTGFGYLLLSMGVSRPKPKPKPETKPAPKAGSGG
jgi:hypothetical protein